MTELHAALYTAEGRIAALTGQLAQAQLKAQALEARLQRLEAIERETLRYFFADNGPAAQARDELIRLLVGGEAP